MSVCYTIGTIGTYNNMEYNLSCCEHKSTGVFCDMISFSGDI